MDCSTKLVPSPVLDFILSLLYCSAGSYKHSSLIDPFPDGFSNSSALTSWMETLDPLVLSDGPTQFISWINSFSEKFSFLLTSPKIFEEETGIPSGNKNIPKPHYIVKFYGHRNERFDDLANFYGTDIGFHGTPTENVYNILNNGPIGSHNRRSLFGQGTYLSSDLGVALSFSKAGVSWKKSILGSNMICVLQCDVLRSDQVKKGVSKLSGISLDTHSLPHNYFVVKDDDHVRVTHVLVYVSKPSKNALGLLGRIISVLKSYWLIITFVLIFFIACFQTKK